MKILNAGQHYFTKGGSDQYLINLGNLLEKHGHEVIPFASRNDNNLESPFNKYFPEGVDTNNPKGLDPLRFIYSSPAKKSINHLLEEVRPDLAHLHIYYAQLTTSILEPLKKRNIPIIQTLHDFKLACPVYSFQRNGHICEDCKSGKFYRALPRKCNRNSMLRTGLSVAESYVSKLMGNESKIDHFITVCQFQKDKLLEHRVTDKSKISVIHNFVEPELFEPDYNTADHILYFGRIESIKGLKTLVEAAAPLNNIPILIAGSGNQKEELRRYIEVHNLNHIKLLGFKSGDELRKLIQDSLCTVMPSESYELCPLSILESMAYGKAVIGANIGGIPELIEHAKNGLLFTSGDVNTLREKLDWCWNNKSAVAVMGREARHKVEATFNDRIHYDKVMEVYRKFGG